MLADLYSDQEKGGLYMRLTQYIHTMEDILWSLLIKRQEK